MTVEKVVCQAFDRLLAAVANRLYEHRQELEREGRRSTEDEFYAIRYVTLLEGWERSTTEDEPSIWPELAALESDAIQQHIFPFERGVSELARRRH